MQRGSSADQRYVDATAKVARRITFIMLLLRLEWLESILGNCFERMHGLSPDFVQ